ncbi:MAG: hypothetical protein JW723_06515 [Bacteroidales bacterium]|nr:hypothetical protein [Bacteroidales bacterium]
MKTLRLFMGLIISMNFVLSHSQNVGINDDNSTPDPSAMLDVKSSDKGILIPRITLTSLNSASPVSNPATGLLVYATSESSVAEGFYYWSGTKWVKIGEGGGSSEPQDLSLSGNTLTLTDDPTSIDLSKYLDNTDNQNLSLSGNRLSITGGNYVDIPTGGTDADADPENELQSLTKSGINITLSNGGGTVSVADNDNDPGNEIQTISKSGSTVTLSGGGGSFTDEVNDADASSSNELQNLSQVLSRGNDAGNYRITNLGDPINDDDAVTKSFLMDLIDGLSVNSIYLEDFNSFSAWQPSYNNSSGCSFTATDGFAHIESMSSVSGWVQALFETDLPLSIPPGTDFSVKTHIIVLDGDPSSALSGTGIELLTSSNESVVHLGHNDSQASSGYGGIQLQAIDNWVFNGDPGGFSTEYPEYSGILEIRRIGNVYTGYVNGQLRGTFTGSTSRTATKIRIHNGRYYSYDYRDGKIDFILITLL